MVRNYISKTDRQSWSEENMLQAIQAWKSGVMRYAKASIQYGCRFQPCRIISGSRKGFAGYLKVFSSEEEDELVSYILKMEELMVGLIRDDVCSLAYQLCMKYNRTSPFNISNIKAGYDWYYGFLKRHSELSLRTPEATSRARARGFNKESVQTCFSLLDNLYEKYKFLPENVYNVDETGITTVQGTPSKIIARKGKKQVGSITSAERGVLVTAVLCRSAAGNYVPPMLIFPRQRWKEELIDGAPPGSKHTYISDMFVQWFNNFLQVSSRGPNKPVLLVHDGHATHTKNITVLDLAKANNMCTSCAFLHTAHTKCNAAS